MNQRILIAPAVALFVLALAAGCGGGGSSGGGGGLPPSGGSSGNGSTGSGGTGGVSASASPSSSPGSAGTAAFAFGGSTAAVALTPGVTPAAATLSPYQNVGAQVQLPPPASGSGTVTIADAKGNGDITPVVPGTTFTADNATAGNTPAMYFSMTNPSTSAINLGSQTPSITLNGSGLPPVGATCELDSKNSSGAWVDTGATGVVTASASGESVTLNPATLSGGNTLNLQPGQTITAVSCN
jgi:hypothetical protein